MGRDEERLDDASRKRRLSSSSRSLSSSSSADSSRSDRESSKKQKSRKRKRSESYSSDSSSSSSQIERKKKKSKRSKVKKKKEDKKKKRKKKSKKSKHKHKKSKDKSKSNSIPAAIDQSVYGKNGIKRREDFYNMREEFEAWLREVKNIEEIPGGANNRDTMELFDTYCEDYNTVTLPQKYYNLKKWETDQQAKAAKKERKHRAKYGEPSKVDFANDEKHAKEQRQIETRRRNIQEAHAMLSAVDKDKAEAMRAQELLRRKMKFLFDTGQYEAARRIQERLKADEK
mmetsp:Transcript_877/g.1086  ORF Transcript_877/g.1086 Transcript_877/m.1086 type:complete len:286 (-) Transcript_877:416-1273(-)|eukprot:CAMPEP_0204830940 /NCGR_PEP_ID=MMETSP1346-20131115/9502_1 /ASSEMBLY_ACC=CAM_ASM_000771 /TAXON_ID=215587 /ORGANISM="Aplanochytrium stocchinoi, Strain GSBS06" /LENGTH=285 /DNA_ID=CAMNT_0051961557 /DNA_START=192 /DNA_END=1049 /DNA_ORIENTATION=-